ncbi:MAG: type II secretion system F family protein [Acidimicrobiia bacterium]
MIAGLATGALVLVVGLAWVGPGRAGTRSRRERRPWFAGLDVAPGRLVAASLGAAGVAFLLGLGFTGIVWVALPPAIAIGLLPGLYWSRRRAVRLAATAAAWPDALRDLSASVAAGLSLTRSLEALATSGPPPIREAMAGYPATARALGVLPALEVVRARLADPVADRVIEVLRVAHERGGSAVPRLLADLADATGEDLRVEEEIRTESLEQRINARAVFVLPWLVLLLLCVREGPFRDFYASPAGLVVIAAGAGLSAIGAVVVGRLARREMEPRVVGGRG